MFLYLSFLYLNIYRYIYNILYYKSKITIYLKINLSNFTYLHIDITFPIYIKSL